MPLLKKVTPRGSFFNRVMESPTQYLNLLIIGHGKMYMADEGYARSFTDPSLSVFTMAPPTATSCYAPEVLAAVRDEVTNTVDSETGFVPYINAFREAQLRHMGVDYCSKDWIGAFGSDHRYDPSKGCNVQRNSILDKEYLFADDHPAAKLVIGIWAYVDGRDQPINILHILSPNLTADLRPRYHFSEVIRLIRDNTVFKKYTAINVIDCSCSVVVTNQTRRVGDYRLQRRLQRQLTRLTPDTPSSRKKTPLSKARTTKRRSIKSHVYTSVRTKRGNK